MKTFKKQFYGESENFVRDNGKCGKTGKHFLSLIKQEK